MGLFSGDKLTTNSTTNAYSDQTGVADQGILASNSTVSADYSQDQNYFDSRDQRAYLYNDYSTDASVRDSGNTTQTDNSVFIDSSVKSTSTSSSVTYQSLDAGVARASIDAGVSQTQRSYDSLDRLSSLAFSTGKSYFDASAGIAREAYKEATAMAVDAAQNDGEQILDTVNNFGKYALYAVLAFAGVAVLRRA